MGTGTCRHRDMGAQWDLGIRGLEHGDMAMADRHMGTGARGCTTGNGDMGDMSVGMGAGTQVHGHTGGHGDQAGGAWGAGLGTGMPSHRDMDTKGTLGERGKSWGHQGCPQSRCHPCHRHSIPGSAVCAFYLADVERAFEGHFAEPRGAAGAWPPVPEERVPRPRYSSPHPAGSPGRVRGACPHAGCATGLAAVPGWARPLPLSPLGTSLTRRWPSPRSTRCCTAPWPPLADGPSSPAPAPGAQGQGGWAWVHGVALCKVPRRGRPWPCGRRGEGKVLVQGCARPWCAGV